MWTRLVALALLLFPLASHAAGEKNIIVVLVDDLVPGAIEAYGAVPGGLGSAYSTPNIDTLAADGVRFTNAYAMPLCQISRAMLLTGKYPPRSQILGNAQVPHASFWTEDTIPELLQDSAAGYTTALIGKSDLGVPPVGEPWDHFAIHTTDQGTFDNPTFFECSTGDLFTCRTTPVQHVGATCASLSDYGAPENATECYVTDELEQMAEDWIADVKDDAGPFFLVISHKASHPQYIPAKRHAGDLAAETPSQPATYDDDRADRVEQVQDYTTTIFTDMYNDWTTAPDYTVARPNGAGKDSSPGGSDAAKKAWVTEELQEDYLETTLALDESIDALRDYLAGNTDENGDLDDETIIIFVSDNGTHLADHGLWQKDKPYTESMLVPLLIAGPDIDPAQVKSQIVTMADVASTILDIANVTEPDDLPGRTLFEVFPTVTNGAWRTSALVMSSWNPGASQPNHSPWYALVSTAWYLIHHYDAQYSDFTPTWELIDRTGDPSELENVYNDPANLTQRETLRETLRTLLSENGMPSWQGTRMVTP